MCGISLVYGDTRGRNRTIGTEIIYSLQHRGQKGVSEVAAVDWHLGHTRYATRGKTKGEPQPLHFPADRDTPEMYLAHNGQLGGFPYEFEHERARLERSGYTFKYTSDTELFTAHLTQSKHDSLDKRIRDAFRNNSGSASIVGVIDGIGFAGRRIGNRPLFTADIRGGGKIFASEDEKPRDIHVDGDWVDIENLREVPEGTFVLYDGKEEKWYDVWDEPFEKRFDVFELIYFSSFNSTYKGVQIGTIREEMGRQLAATHVPDADIVCAIPNSGNSAAKGYAEQSGVPLVQGITRYTTSGRNFTLGSQEEREDKIQRKFRSIRKHLKGQRVIAVDDSLVRGTTMRWLNRFIRRAGAEEVHFVIASPPVKHPAMYGINVSSYDELQMHKRSQQEIISWAGIDSLTYLPINRLYKAIHDKTGVSREGGNFSDEILTGKYWHNK